MPRRESVPDEKKIDAIIRQGKYDYFTQKGVYKNPYRSGSAEFNAYERGWMQSLKQVKHPFPGGSNVGPSFADRYRNMPNWRGPGDDKD